LTGLGCAKVTPVEDALLEAVLSESGAAAAART
jgi:hypothetical protein